MSGSIFLYIFFVAHTGYVFGDRNICHDCTHITPYNSLCITDVTVRVVTAKSRDWVYSGLSVTDSYQRRWYAGTSLANANHYVNATDFG